MKTIFLAEIIAVFFPNFKISLSTRTSYDDDIKDLRPPL